MSVSGSGVLLCQSPLEGVDPTGPDPLAEWWKVTLGPFAPQVDALTTQLPRGQVKVNRTKCYDDNGIVIYSVKIVRS